MNLSPRILIPLALLITAVVFTRMANTRGAPAGGRVDVLRYDLALTLMPDSGGLSGKERIAFTLTPPSPRARFDASSRTITIDSVTGREGPLRFSHSGDDLLIDLAGTRAPSETLSVTIWYHAVSAFDGRYDSGGIYFHRDSGRLRVGTISQPNFARQWWPCNDHPSDKALVSLTCTVPQGMVVVSNGRQGPVETGVGGRTYSWESAYPVATYLVFLGAAEYAVTSDTMGTAGGGTLELLTYAFPEDSALAAADFANIKPILRFLSTTFGPYPFQDDKFAIAEVEGSLTMENQTVVTIENDLVTGDRRNENTLVHETAHQWWGDLVTPSSWKHIWLTEAFATMSEALYIEHRRGPEIYSQYMDVLMDQPAGYYAGPIVGGDSATFWESFSPAVYYKGALTLHMLRRMMGDTAFFASLRDYLDSPAHRYGNARTEDFIHICESRYGSPLGWFFNQWLSPPGGAADRPELAYTWTTTGTGRNRELVVDLRQEQEGELVYRLPFRVRVHAGGTVDTFPVIDSTRRQEFRRPAGAGVDSVVIDPDRDIFMTITGRQAP
jgi:aminopeptidase N